MENCTPRWTCVCASQLALLGFCLPFLEVRGRTWSLFQLYEETGFAFLAWSLVILLLLALFAAILDGWGAPLEAGAAAVGWGVFTISAMCWAVPPAIVLAHLRAGAWLYAVGAVGLTADALWNGYRCFRGRRGMPPSQAGGGCTPHFLFDASKRKRAVHGVKEKTLLGPKLRLWRSLGQTGVGADTAREFQ